MRAQTDLYAWPVTRAGGICRFACQPPTTAEIGRILFRVWFVLGTRLQIAAEGGNEVIKALLAMTLLAFAAPAMAQCQGCAQKAQAVTRPIPGTNESILVGKIENLIPIAVVMSLGCESCAEKTVAWALEQGSTKQDVERVLATVEAMQKLDCFKGQFGPDTVSRLEKPLAAARRALQQAVKPDSK